MIAPRIRLPAVAGRFYPADAGTLTQMLDAFVGGPGNTPERALGIVVPHAGYMYSGAVAGAVYSRIEIPSRAIILCPNHTGMGPPLSIMRSGAWQTPLGTLRIDSDLCDALMAADPALEDDTLAHKLEHSLEVQLPFLQHIAGDKVRFAPITVGVGDWDALENLGRAVARAVQDAGAPVLIIASSDMNHYESDAITRIKDARAIDPMLKRDARGLVQTVRRDRISMCGYGPAAAMLVATGLLNSSKAELVRYATSADVSGDFDRVVGYAGLIVV